MNYFKPIAVFTTAFLLTACLDVNPAQHQEVNESGNNPYNIELNDGEKWKVNEEMMVHIRAMKSEIKMKLDGPDSYVELGSRLNEHINLLTASCTMKGKAHDELHKWLLPFIDLVEELRATETSDQGRERLKAVEDAFRIFDRYFY